MSEKRPVIIAIDGPAASGKGSLAKKLAEVLDYDFLDTGALYRRVALKVLEQKIDVSDENSVAAKAEELRAEIAKPYDDSALRNDKVGNTASIIAQNQRVRDILFNSQREFALNANNGAVLDGRDIGTVICPNADIKLFVTASLDKRAERRLKELQSHGKHVTQTQVLAEMQERDDRDAVRLNKHLAPDHNVTIIDTSDMTPEEVLETAMKLVKETLSPRS